MQFYQSLRRTTVRAFCLLTGIGLLGGCAMNSPLLYSAENAYPQSSVTAATHLNQPPFDWMAQ